jgi:hypothetical protein
MVTIVNIPNWIWPLCFAFGVIISILFNRVLNRVGKSIKLKIPIPRFEYLALIVNLLFLVWNAAFLLGITAVTAKASQLTISGVNTLVLLSTVFQILAYVTLGFALGEIAFVIIQGIDGKRAKNKPEEVEITISTKRLESISKEVEECRKAKTYLDDFFKKL